MLNKLKKYQDIIFLVIVILIIAKIIQNYQWFLGIVGELSRILAPFFWAFGTAFLLNPLMKYIEKKIHTKRLFTLIIIYTLLIGLLILFIVIVTPRITNSVTELVKNMPQYYKAFQNSMNSFLDSRFFDNAELNKMIKETLGTIFESVFAYFNDFLSNLVSKVIGLTSGILQFLVGLIISVYMLYDKEHFQDFAKKVLNKLFESDKSKGIIEWGSIANSVFTDFFIGKTIDSLIIGILCGIGLTIIGAPYPFLLSVVVGVFNMIPYVGPFIGAVPTIILTLFIVPQKTIWVALFILILQQFDGNILGPKILGNRLGIRPIYVVLAIFIGGGFFGMFGMLVGVPLFKMFSIVLDRLMGEKKMQV